MIGTRRKYRKHRKGNKKRHNTRRKKMLREEYLVDIENVVIKNTDVVQEDRVNTEAEDAENLR